MLTFMWAIGLNSTLILFLQPPVPEGYGFSNTIMGLLYLGPMVSFLFYINFNLPSELIFLADRCRHW